MADLQGLAHFPGINQVFSARYTLSHGVQPGVAEIEIVPQLNFVGAAGPLTFTYGSRRIVFPDCKVDQFSFQRNRSGLIWSLSIFDRRWRWAWGTIHGRYNVRQGDARLRKGTEKNPRELAKLCFEAMGERVRDSDVAALPKEPRPEVEWDYQRPAPALQALVDSLGCRVVLGLDNRVRIVRVNQGRALPNLSSVSSDSGTIDPPEIPDEIGIATGRNLYERAFELEAVGKDTDGTIKLIDDLSYKPAGGWGNSTPGYFNEVADADDPADESDNSPRKLAKATVFRWYRIKTGFELPGFEDDERRRRKINVDDLWRVLPIETEMLATETVNDADGNQVKRRREAEVYGVYWDMRADMLNTSEDDLEARTEAEVLEKLRYRDSFSIDRQLGIVKFGKPVHQMETLTLSPLKLKFAPARLAVVTACGVRDQRTFQWKRTIRRRRLARFGTPAKVVKRDEIQPHYWVQNYGDAFSISSMSDNLAEVNQEADYYLDAMQRSLIPETPQSREYIGLVSIAPDGAIMQVTWEVGPGGAKTRASRNYESEQALLTYKEKQFLEKLGALELKTPGQEKRAADREARR